MLDQVAVRETDNAQPAPKPTAAEHFFFDTFGYLVLENFLAADQVERLKAALSRVIERRRTAQTQGIAYTGMTQIKGEKSTCIFYILDDDPLLLELLDWPPLMPYVTGLLNQKPHHHASDAIVEYGSELNQRALGWHIDGHDNGFRNLGKPVPLLQLKVGYYLSAASSFTALSLTRPNRAGGKDWMLLAPLAKTVCPRLRASRARYHLCPLYPALRERTDATSTDRRRSVPFP